MKIRTLLTLFSFILFISLTQAQQQVPGELIIQLNKEVDSQSFFQQLSQDRSDLLANTQTSAVVDMWRIHLLKYDAQRVDGDAIIAALSAHSDVQAVGHNFKLEKRSVTTNDPLFSGQWGLSIIDADEVWECSTGGTTIMGDTIVIANLEDCDVYHEDLIDNIWINHGEIPNNNMDDDGNGFVDDYRGYNVGTENDNHPGQSNHGTQTAGIMGASGNNGIGISGVNWNIKMMVVSNNLQFDQIVTAYYYVLEQRRLYNKTNGAKGTFVVATNASFGAPGFPSSNPFFPAWCEVYDSLGMQGVVSAGATTNSRIDIDDTGDMPTSCQSEFLITVTDVNQTSELRGGFSAVNIDIGAPGTTSPATSTANGYSPIDGTSAATPHVTGGIGLLYSLPCDDFIELAHNDPAAAALQMKSFILSGTAPIASLEGKTVTGGMLNLKNSMDIMQDYCGSSTGVLDFLRIYPNPADDFVTVEYQTPGNDKYDIRVYDAIGRLVHYRTVEPAKFEEKEIVLNVNDWATGLYFISIENPNNIVSTRFMVY